MTKTRCRAKNPATCRTHGTPDPLNVAVGKGDFNTYAATRDNEPQGIPITFDPELQHKLATKIQEGQTQHGLNTGQSTHYAFLRTFFANAPYTPAELAYLVKQPHDRAAINAVVRDNTTLAKALQALGVNHRDAYHAEAEATGLPLKDRSNYQSYTAFARRTNSTITPGQIIDMINQGRTDIYTVIRQAPTKTY